MKNAKRFFVITFMLAFILSISSINAFAATVTQDNLEVTLVTDKENYSENEQIKTTLTVKNNNETAVANVDLETALPDGYTIADNTENKKTVDSIAAGEAVSLELSLIKKSTPDEPSTDPKSSTNPVSGGNSSGSGTTTSGTTSGSAVQTGQSLLVIGVVLVVLFTTGIAFVFLYRKSQSVKRTSKELLSIALCLGIVCGTLSISFTTLVASGISKKEIEVKTSVEVQMNRLDITGKIIYEFSDSKKDMATVVFDSNGGINEPEKVEVKIGETVSSPFVPTKEGYVFCGWYNNPDAEPWIDTIDLTTYKITDDITLYALWGSENFDIDGDGLSHKEENLYKTDPYLYDTDGDGLSDGKELQTYHTNPLQVDTDGDGLFDDFEINVGLNPLLICSDTITNDAEKEISYLFSDLEDNYSLTVSAKAKALSSINTSSISKDIFDNSSEIISNIISIEMDSNVNAKFESATLDYYYGDYNLEKETENNLSILYLNDTTKKCEIVPSVIDKENKRISANLPHFSKYVIGSKILANSYFSLQTTSIIYNGNEINTLETAHSGFDLFKHSFAFHNFQTRKCPGGFCYGFAMVTYLNYLQKLPITGERFSTIVLSNVPGYDLNQASRFSENQLYIESEKDYFTEENNYESDGVELSNSALETLYCIEHWFGKQHNVIDQLLGPNILERKYFNSIKSKLNSGQPVMLSLYKSFGNGSHSVLAYGMYQTKDADYILVYDCNKPGKTSYIKLSKYSSIYTSAEYGSYSTIRLAYVPFPDGPYVDHIIQQGKGTLYGKIYKASDRTTVIPNARITVSNENRTIYDFSNTTGAYSIRLPEGQYSITVHADDYIDFIENVTITNDEKTTLDVFLEDANGFAKGKITNSLTNAGVEGVTLRIRNGWDNTSSSAETVATTTTNSSGNYSVELPLGKYTVIASKDGYETSSFNITVNSGTTDNQNAELIPVGESLSEEMEKYGLSTLVGMWDTPNARTNRLHDCIDFYNNPYSITGSSLLAAPYNGTYNGYQSINTGTDCFFNYSYNNKTGELTVTDYKYYPSTSVYNLTLKRISIAEMESKTNRDGYYAFNDEKLYFQSYEFKKVSANTNDNYHPHLKYLFRDGGWGNLYQVKLFGKDTLATVNDITYSKMFE